MTDDQFNAIIMQRQSRIHTILASKASEYAHGDRLSNFKEAASFLHCTPEKALLGFVGKHIIALRDFVEDLEKGKVQPLEQWDEKLGDIINYMVLLEGLLRERFDAADDRAAGTKEGLISTLRKYGFEASTSVDDIVYRSKGKDPLEGKGPVPPTLEEFRAIAALQVAPVVERMREFNESCTDPCEVEEQMELVFPA